MKLTIAALVFLFIGKAIAQTPPVQPQTPNIKVPPRVLLPSETVEAGKQPLTVTEAVQIALKNQPQIGIARGDLLSAQGRTQQSRSDLLPQLSATGGYTRTSRISGGSSTGSSNGGQFSSGLNLDQLLFDFGRTRDAVRQQSALQRAQEQVLLLTQQNVVFLVKQAFYDYQQNRLFTSIAEENIKNRQHQLDEAQARLDTGLGAPGDVVQAKTSLADSVIALENARQIETASKVFLAQQLGINPLTPIVPAADESEPALTEESDLQKLVEAAMANRPDIKAAMQRVSAAKYGVSSASKGNLPRFSLTAGVGSRGANNPFDTNTGTVGLLVSWNFADGGFTAGQVKSARGNEIAAENDLIATSQGAVTEVSQTWLLLQTAQQRIETATAQVANAQEYVRISEGRYSGGLGQFLDVVSAQSALVSAQRNLAQARQDVSRARAQLRVAIGSL